MKNKDFDKLVLDLGTIYAKFIAHLKSDLSIVAPNDHVIGPIGEWRAIQIIEKEMGLKASRVSASARDPDDLKVEYEGKVHYISVKTTTEHSKTGLSGIFHTDKGNWEWTICVRLNHDLTYKEHFWLHKKDCQVLFRTKSDKVKQFKWSIANNSSKKCEFPNWFNKTSKTKKVAA